MNCNIWRRLLMYVCLPQRLPTCTAHIRQFSMLVLSWVQSGLRMLPSCPMHSIVSQLQHLLTLADHTYISLWLISHNILQLWESMLALKHSRKTNSDHPGCHVECDLGCQTNSAPEFRYIMHLAAETDRWTHKLLLSFSTAGQTWKPESFYIMPLLLGRRSCHAGFVFMQISLCRRPVNRTVFVISFSVQSWNRACNAHNDAMLSCDLCCPMSSRRSARISLHHAPRRWKPGHGQTNFCVDPKI